MYACMYACVSEHGHIHKCIHEIPVYWWLCKQVVREAELPLSAKCNVSVYYVLYLYVHVPCACLLLSSFLLISH